MLHLFFSSEVWFYFCPWTFLNFPCAGICANLVVPVVVVWPRVDCGMGVGGKYKVVTLAGDIWLVLDEIDRLEWNLAFHTGHLSQGCSTLGKVTLFVTCHGFPAIGDESTRLCVA